MASRQRDVPEWKAFEQLVARRAITSGHKPRQQQRRDRGAQPDQSRSAAAQALRIMAAA